MSPQFVLIGVWLFAHWSFFTNAAMQTAPSFLENDHINQTKTSASEAIQYVSAHGKDSSDGLSWETAKLTVMAAYDSLPSNGGTIYISSGTSFVNATSTAGQGIWIMGPTDPNYASPPAGWRRAKHVTFWGLGGSGGGPGTYSSKAEIEGGTNSDNTKPFVKLSGVTVPMLFKNIGQVNPAGRGIVVGEDSNGGRTGRGACSEVNFDNVDAGAGSGATNGPAIDITGGTLESNFYHMAVSGNASAAAGTNQSVGILLDGTGNPGVVILSFADIHIAGPGDGFKWIPGNSISSFTIDGFASEATVAPAAAVHLTSNANVIARINNVDLADCTGSGTNPIRVDAGPGAIGVNPDSVSVSDIVSGCGDNIVGEAAVVGPQWMQVLNGQTISPTRYGQTGVIKGRVIGQIDSSRRSFAPFAVRFRNLASSTPSGWAWSLGTITTGIAAPDGTNGAGQTVAASGQGLLEFYNISNTITVGDYWIAGAWIRATNGYAGGATGEISFGVAGTGNAVTKFDHNPPWAGDGEWQWVWTIQKVSAVGTTPAMVTWGVVANSRSPVQAYAPVVIRIPAGTVSDNEAYEIAYNLQSYSSNAAVGTISGLPGQTLSQTFLIPDGGAAFANANVTLTGGWGVNAAVSAARGSAQRFIFTVEANGTGITANPKMVIKFPNAWPVTPIFSCKQVGGTGALTTVSGEGTASKTTMTLTFNGAPASGSTYAFVCEGE